MKKDYIKSIYNSKETSSVKFNELTKIKNFVKSDKFKYPKSWTEIHFKEYPRFPKIKLKKESLKSINLFDVIKKRKSYRKFRSYPISSNELSKILVYSGGILHEKKDLNKTRRSHPSGGARYPLEIYPVVLNSKNIKKGIYHYNVKQHLLELILHGDYRKEMMNYTDQEWVDKSSVVLLISAVFDRTKIKYGDRGYRYILFEAGHMGQNISLITTALGLKSCAIGGFLDDKFNELLDIDGTRESVIYIIAVGK